jgi:hypothetical protein
MVMAIRRSLMGMVDGYWQGAGMIAMREIRGRRSMIGMVTVDRGCGMLIVAPGQSVNGREMRGRTLRDQHKRQPEDQYPRNSCSNRIG